MDEGRESSGDEAPPSRYSPEKLFNRRSTD